MSKIVTVPRTTPLTPCAVLGLGSSSRALVQRLLALDPAQLSRLQGVAAAELVVVLGASDDLPWCDGVQYLGREAETPSLLLPCAVAPSVPVALLSRALALRLGEAALRARCALSLEPPLLIPLGDARTLSAARLRRWQGAA